MKRLIILLLLLCLVFGCATANTQSFNYQFIDDWCNFLQESEEATCKCGLETIAFIKSALGTDLYALDAEALVVLEKMEGIYKSSDELTKVQKAELAGLWTRFFSKLTSQAINIIGPALLKIMG